MDFFNPEKQPWQTLGKAVDFVGLSLCCVFCSLGIVTLGPSLIALYVSVVKTFRFKDNTAFRLYFRTFKESLRQGIIVTLICIPVFAIIVYGYSIMKLYSGTQAGAFAFTAYYVFLIIPVGTLLNLFPLMGRFEMSVKDLFKTSLSLTVGHLPSTLIIVLFSVELTVWTISDWIPAFITPSLWALFSSFFFERNYEKHLTDEECAKLRGVSLKEYLKDKNSREKFLNKFRRNLQNQVWKR